jgi:hypothetical protein
LLVNPHDLQARIPTDVGREVLTLALSRHQRLVVGLYDLIRAAVLVDTASSESDLKDRWRPLLKADGVNVR